MRRSAAGPIFQLRPSVHVLHPVRKMPLQSDAVSPHSDSDTSSSSGEDLSEVECSSPMALVDGAKMNLSSRELNAERLQLHLDHLGPGPDRLLRVHKLVAQNNAIECLPLSLFSLANLSELDLSNNSLSQLPDVINTHLPRLTHLVLRNNMLTDTHFPKDLSQLARSLKYLNLSGNQFRSIPPAVLQLTGLKELYLGGNQIQEVPCGIRALQRLRFLYLGGNELMQLPGEICQLVDLHALILCNNRLTSLPDCICKLKKLKCLQLHSNKLTILPHGLIFCNSLDELSLRDNPLVARFARDMDFQVSSLLELAARVIKIHRIPYLGEGELPAGLVKYLSSAQQCVNAKCSGVYFESRVEHVKFVDFCGKYRIPLMQYLCSSRCHDLRPAVSVQDEEKDSRIKKVLLG